MILRTHNKLRVHEVGTYLVRRYSNFERMYTTMRPRH